MPIFNEPWFWGVVAAIAVLAVLSSIFEARSVRRKRERMHSEGYVDCPNCRGYGWVQDTSTDDNVGSRRSGCPDCKGEGFVLPNEVQRIRRNMRLRFVLGFILFLIIVGGVFLFVTRGGLLR